MTTLPSERQVLYNQILGSVKNSPIKTIEFEGNTYHFKLEYKLPYGECHYARIFSKLIYLKECLGIIKPGDTLLETTSGSGGRAAAAIAIALGYKIVIALPAGGEKAREEAILKTGAELVLTPAELYVNGFPEFVKQYLKENPEFKYLNHVMGDIFGRGTAVNGNSINAFRPFIEEVAAEGIVPDIVISPLGNGTNTLPTITDFKALFRKVKVYGFESLASANAYRKFYPGKYENIFGIVPEMLSRHDMPGSTPVNSTFPMPALEKAIPLLDGIALVTSNKVNRNFLQVTGFLPTEKSSWVAKWDDYNLDEMSEFGRTGKAGFAVALKIVEKENLKGKHFLIPVFDAAWHYDS